MSHGVLVPIMLHIVNVQSTGESLLSLPSHHKSKCKAVQRTVVPGNWMDDRQSDSSIVPLMESNVFGGKGAACGNILRGDLLNTQWLIKTGEQILRRTLISTQGLVR